jgi:O-acetyl-ADP-ribose deacetylase (regulator of RNase III)
MFIAPELWAGEPATARTDLYSAAATLHLLWQRDPPFSADTATDLARLHREQPYVPPACADPVAAYFGAVLARLLAKNPCDRPESALLAARLLERIATPPPGLRGHDHGYARVADVSIALEQGDICDARTDVIVCAANERLTMERGVSGAVRARGGDEIQTEAMKHGPVTMGQVVWTQPGTLACKQIAHAVSALDGAICIQRAVLRTLFEADRLGHASISFPALGTGVGAVPVAYGARLMLEAIRTFAAFQPSHLRTIRITLATAEYVAAWTSAMIALDTDAATD